MGNLGVGLAQLIAPIAMYGGALLILGGSAQTRVDQGATMQIWVQNAGFIWVPLIVLAVVAAWFGMDNIATVRAGFAEQVAIIRHKQQWRMSWLYTGTFGSFIGLAAGFPMLVNTEFPAVDAFKFAFIGPVLAALVRPLGGWLADRMGGAMITFWIFVVMAVAPLVAVFFLPTAGGGGSLLGFVLAFMALFVAAGIGNGSTFRMIPIIFRTLRERAVADPNDQAALEQARRVGSTEGAATLGFSSAVAALRRLLHPDRLRHLDQADGQPAGGAGLLQRVLPELRAGDLALVCAPGRRGGVLTTPRSPIGRDARSTRGKRVPSGCCAKPARTGKAAAELHDERQRDGLGACKHVRDPCRGRGGVGCRRQRGLPRDAFAIRVGACHYARSHVFEPRLPARIGIRLALRAQKEERIGTGCEQELAQHRQVIGGRCADHAVAVAGERVDQQRERMHDDRQRAPRRSCQELPKTRREQRHRGISHVVLPEPRLRVGETHRGFDAEFPEDVGRRDRVPARPIRRREIGSGTTSSARS